MNVKETLAAIRALGLTVRKTEHGEYRVNYPSGDDTTAYYAKDIDDALLTARAMSDAKDLLRRGAGRKPPRLVPPETVKDTLEIVGHELCILIALIQVPLAASDGDVAELLESSHMITAHPRATDHLRALHAKLAVILDARNAQNIQLESEE